MYSILLFMITGWLSATALLDRDKAQMIFGQDAMIASWAEYEPEAIQALQGFVSSKEMAPVYYKAAQHYVFKESGWTEYLERRVAFYKNHRLYRNWDPEQLDEHLRKSICPEQVEPFQEDVEHTNLMAVAVLRDAFFFDERMPSCVERVDHVLCKQCRKWCQDFTEGKHALSAESIERWSMNKKGVFPMALWMVGAWNEVFLCTAVTPGAESRSWATHGAKYRNCYGSIKHDKQHAEAYVLKKFMMHKLFKTKEGVEVWDEFMKASQEIVRECDNPRDWCDAILYFFNVSHETRLVHLPLSVRTSEGFCGSDFFNPVDEYLKDIHPTFSFYGKEDFRERMRPFEKLLQEKMQWTLEMSPEEALTEETKRLTQNWLGEAKETIDFADGIKIIEYLERNHFPCKWDGSLGVDQLKVGLYNTKRCGGKIAFYGLLVDGDGQDAVLYEGILFLSPKENMQEYKGCSCDSKRASYHLLQNVPSLSRPGRAAL